MQTQFSFWLYPLILFALLAFVLRARLGFAWAWGFLIQVSLIGACGLLGLAKGPDWIYAPVGWLLFFVFAVLPRLILARLDNAVSLLRSNEAIECAQKLKWFYWGQPGQFWIDMTRANAYFLERRVDDAKAILTKWDEKKLPKAVKDVVYSYRLSGHAVLGQWQEIVDEYEKAAAGGAHVSHRLSLSASRAYLEVGNADMAEVTLKRSQLNESRASSKSVALTLLPYFALLGSTADTNRVFETAYEKNSALPEYVKLYWMARCYVAAGNSGEARIQFLRCLDEVKTKQAPVTWQLRAQNQLDKLNRNEQAQLIGNVRAALQTGRTILDQCEFVEKVIFPKQTSFAVTALVTMIMCVEVFRFIPDGFTNITMRFMGEFGKLDAHLVWQGQWWRLVTYLFLHAHISHALLNVIGLYWFGKMAVNIYGPQRFLFIYFASGILSGVTHIVLAPSMPAVGASGAIMGIFGAVAAGIWRLKDHLPRGVRRQELSWMLGLALSQVVLDQFIPHVASMAHLGGLVFGFIIGVLIQPQKAERSEVIAQEIGVQEA